MTVTEKDKVDSLGKLSRVLRSVSYSGKVISVAAVNIPSCLPSCSFSIGGAGGIAVGSSGISFISSPLPLAVVLVELVVVEVVEPVSVPMVPSVVLLEVVDVVLSEFEVLPTAEVVEGEVFVFSAVTCSCS